VRTRIDERFLDQVAAFRLRHGCEDCFHFVDETCAHEWPNAEHHAILPGTRLAQLDRRELVFCKEFELR
jgi:hypothetical protein